MTALSSEDQRKRGEQLGADKYLVKSQVGIEDVVRAVHEALGDLPGRRHKSSASFTTNSHIRTSRSNSSANSSSAAASY